MKRLSEAVIAHRRLIIWITVILCAVSIFAMQSVNVNYDLSIYLPEKAPTVAALGVIRTAAPNLQLYLPGLSAQESLDEKEKLASLNGVESILWLDDVVDLRDMPLEMLEPSVVNQYFLDGPLFQLTLKENQQSLTVPAIRELYPEGLLKGTAADNAQQVNVTMAQIASIMYYVVPLCLIILILATRHWIEPLLFVMVIGTAILLNEGSNVVLGSVSYITRACSAILQLAVSIDYAIFLLHRFSDYRDEGMEPADAMKMAMRKASGAVAASATTTIFGFLALVLMDFTLGADMGIVLAKGVLLSFLSVMIVLPAVTVTSANWIDKTRHRSFIPSFKRFGRFVIRFGAPVAIILLLSLPLAFLTQKQNTFIYGSGGMHTSDSPLRLESKEIEDRFGRSRMLLLMVPEGDRSKEKQLSDALEELPGIQSVLSYARTVSAEIPPQVLPETVSGQFYADGFARFILLSDRDDEGPAAFAQVEQIRQLAASYYPAESHLLGESAVNFDLMTFITADNLKVLLAGIISIGLVLMVNFRSLSIPLILLIVIQGSIWLNMAAPYIMGSPLNYIGYQIVSSVQLGATVDYGILLSQRYLEGRGTLKPGEAAAWALEVSAGSILPPAMILMLAGYSLGILVQDNRIISEMGIIIGRGAALSCVMVLLVLPQVLAWCDRLIQKTTLKSRKADS
jgi:predicted RND superfamily exporter protein